MTLNEKNRNKYFTDHITHFKKDEIEIEKEIEQKMSNNFEKEYIELFEKMTNICYKNGAGDPFSYARGKEIYQAFKLGHTVAETYSGPDAINRQGKKVEYKSTISDKINATYNGISIMDTWEEQEKYLKEQKIECYEEHYFSRFDKNGEIVETWKMSGAQVYSILEPKLKKKFHKRKNVKKTLKDPRLGATISEGEIYKYGIKV